MHSLGIIHRDFRAANMLIVGRDPIYVVVADFGVSHQLRVYEQVSLVNGTDWTSGKFFPPEPVIDVLPYFPARACQ